MRVEWRALFRRRSVEAELEEELQLHRERQFIKYVGAGLSQAEAARRVRMDFGGVDQVKEECRDARGVAVIENFLRDLRYGFRSLCKSPGFTVAALLTFALGIGANTAIFSILYSVLLRALPFANSQQLLVLNETTPKVGVVSVSYPNFRDWQAQTHSFSGMSFLANTGFNIQTGNRTESFAGQAVTPNFLSLTGIRLFAGRDFSPDEKEPVVVISYALAQSQFGNGSLAIGKTLVVDQKPFTVIGVLPRDFRWIEKTDLIEPLRAWMPGHPELEDRGNRSDMIAVARLRPGVSLASAETEMTAIAARLAREYPADDSRFGVKATPLREAFAGDLRPAVVVLFVAAIFVFLIACANVSSLLLVRGMSRTMEISMRMALGASRSRIVLQMIAESLLLTSAGTAAGLLIAFAIDRGMAAMIPGYVLRGATPTLRGAPLLFAAVLSVAVAVVFGLAPSLRSHLELKKWRRSAGARNLLATAEVCLALVLLVGAALMTKSLYRLLAVDPGVRTEHVLTTDIDLPSPQYDKDAAELEFWTRLLDGVRRIPGVESAALGTNVPLTFEHNRSDITLEGFPEPKPGVNPHPDVHIVSSGYLATLQAEVLRGRGFTEFDDQHSTPVGLINARLAKQFFANSDPLGHRFLWAKKWITIAGVVQDTKLYGLDNPSRLEIYVPMRQLTPQSMTLVVRSSVDPDAMSRQILAAITELDPNQPLEKVKTLDQLVAESVWTQRTMFVLLTLFSGIALLLAVVGIYGIVSFSVTQRGREFGLRIALGAQRSDVIRLVIQQGVGIAFVGGGLGIACSLVLTRLMSKLLFAVTAFDPAIFAAVTGALLGIVVVAAYIPARRTARLDAVTTLRCE